MNILRVCIYVCMHVCVPSTVYSPVNKLYRPSHMRKEVG
jgi:hypothetical protein